MSGTVCPPPHLFTEMLRGLAARYASSRVRIHVCYMVPLQSGYWVEFLHMYIAHRNLHKLEDTFQTSVIRFIRLSVSRSAVAGGFLGALGLMGSLYWAIIKQA